MIQFNLDNTRSLQAIILATDELQHDFMFFKIILLFQILFLRLLNFIKSSLFFFRMNFFRLTTRNVH